MAKINIAENSTDEETIAAHCTARMAEAMQDFEVAIWYDRMHHGQSSPPERDIRTLEPEYHFPDCQCLRCYSLRV